MTGKESALYALMEEQGYSYGLLNTAIQILGQSTDALDEMIDYIYDQRPTEEEFIERMATLCE